MQINKKAVAGALFGSLALSGVALAATHSTPSTVQSSQVGTVQSQAPDTKDMPDVAESTNAVDTDNVQEGNQNGQDNQAGDTKDGAETAN